MTTLMAIDVRDVGRAGRAAVPKPELALSVALHTVEDVN
jgi:hypothetical protein